MMDKVTHRVVPSNHKKGLLHNKWFSLSVILMISICNQWQRFALAYAYGYKADIESTGDKGFYMISETYPTLK